MKPFTYRYQETTHNGIAEPFIEDGNRRYRIILDNGESLIIAAAGWRTPDDRTIWMQCDKKGEKVYPHEMVQALGEKLEKADIN